MKQQQQFVKLITFPPSSGVINQTIVLTQTLLGKGQFGSVFYAYDQADPTKGYAVKTIERKKIDNEPILITNMMREI